MHSLFLQLGEKQNDISHENRKQMSHKISRATYHATSDGQRSTHADKRRVGAKITLIQLNGIVRRMPLPATA